MAFGQPQLPMPLPAHQNCTAGRLGHLHHPELLTVAALCMQVTCPSRLYQHTQQQVLHGRLLRSRTLERQAMPSPLTCTTKLLRPQRGSGAALYSA